MNARRLALSTLKACEVPAAGWLRSSAAWHSTWWEFSASIARQVFQSPGQAYESTFSACLAGAPSGDFF